MQTFPTTMVLRHRKENLKKCSLHGLEEREDFAFYSYPQDSLPTLQNYVLLSLDAPPLTVDDQNYGLFVIDSTWRYTPKMLASITHKDQLIPRSLPSNFRTAYPRKQDDCSDPSRGLASIEAIFLAYSILGRSTDGLLDRYHWVTQFLESNSLTLG